MTTPLPLLFTPASELNPFPDSVSMRSPVPVFAGSDPAVLPDLPPSTSRSLLFIDSNLPDYQTLVAGVAPGTDVYHLNSTQDAIAQITNTLLGREGIESIHIVSHGQAGSLQLGQTWLNGDTLAVYQDQLQTWQSALTADADILLYGCDVAAGAVGQSFVKQLAALTGADVAASTDRTGNRALGGNWVLEFNTGSIAAELAFTQSVQDTYTDTLAFVATPVLTVGSGPNFVAVGDFNGDGNADFATANRNSNDVSIRLGDGLGGFSATTAVAVGGNPIAVAIGDFNGDGRADLATANYGSGTVSIRLGDGAGGFSGTTDIAVESGPAAVAIADFNRDGRADLAVTNGLSNTVSIRLGDGLGGVSGTTTLAIGSFAQSLVIADFNGDGRDDFATTNVNLDNVSIWLGDGLGGFSGTPSVAVGDAPGGIVSADFNGDGSIDLATADQQGGVSIRLGDGLGGFGGTTTVAVGAGPLAVAIADFNGDGKADLATANQFSNDVSIRFGDGLGGFGGTTTVAVGLTPSAVAIADFNNDGKADIIASNFNAGTVSVLLNTSPRITVAVGTTPAEIGITGTFTLTLDTPAPPGGLTVNFAASGTATNLTDYSFTAGSNITSIGATSFVIAAGATSATLNVVPVSDGIIDPNETVQLTLTPGNDYILGNPTARFVAAATVAVGTNPTAIARGDFNGDGRIDLAIANEATNTVSIRLGDGNGNFSGATEVGVGAGPWSVAIADFNRDGSADLATADAGSDTVSIRLGNGNGTFSVSTNVVVGSNPWFVTTEDFNGDGIVDLAVASEGANTVAIRLGNGDGTFSGSTNVGVGTNPWFIATGDFNGDGRADFAAANLDSNNVSIRLGNGDGTFTGSTDIAVEANPWAVAIADFNTDGKADLAITNYNASTVSIRLGNGDGTFSGSTNVAVGTNPWFIVTGDFNGDGNADLATANNGSQSVSMRLGNGGGGFDDANEIPLGTVPWAIATGDFNRDGRVDLATANYDSNTVSVLLNAAPTASLTIADVPTLSVATGITPVENTSTNGTFTLTIANPAPIPLTVSYALSGLATNGSDYTLVAGAGITNIDAVAQTFTIAAGITTATLIVQVIDDIAAEADETIVLTLTNQTNYHLDTATATLTLGQNDFVVTNTNDSGEGSLRQAVQNASDFAGADTITFNLAANSVITLNSPLDPTDSDETAIDGRSVNGLTISGGDTTTVFAISSGTIVTLNGLTISGGRSPIGFGGGGIFNNGTLTVSNSTIANNDSDGGGGGIFNFGTLTLNNSTISGNRGGGITNGRMLTVSNSTISGNTATSEGGGIFNLGAGTVTIRNSIVAGNSAPDGREIFSFAPIASGGYNLFGFNGNSGLTGNITTATTDIIPTVALSTMLTPLGNYGGPTQTHALLPGSPAIDSGNATDAPTTDQRGISRVGAVDIGAFESRGFTITPTAGTPQGTLANTAFGTPLSAIVTSAFNEPVAGGTVIFTAPDSGASGSFASTAPVTINGAGGVTASTFTANGVAGTYNVTAGGSGIASPARFNLTNIPLISLAAGTDPVENIPTNGTFTLTLTPSVTPIAVSYTLAGSAIAGADYTLIPGAGIVSIDPVAQTFVIAAGVSTATLVVQVIDDIAAEADETIQLTLTGGGTSYALDTAIASLTIAANDFVVTNINDSGEGSLRQALLNANAIAGTDTVRFAIAGTGTQTITLNTVLPTITEQVIIDGYTQAGSAQNSLAIGNNAVLNVILNGNGIAAGGRRDGLTLADGADGSVIQGLVIRNFANHGIWIQAGSDGNTIRGNFIGTNGTADLGNGDDGVAIESSGNLIGGSNVGDRNIIAGNNRHGISLLSVTASNTQIRGNYIGTNAAGTATLGNGDHGIQVFGSNHVIGGSTVAERNLIAGNTNDGIRVGGSNTQIQGNYIGTDGSGTVDLGNGSDGIEVNNVANTAITGNLIAGNSGYGVQIIGINATGNGLQGNRIGTQANGTTALGNSLSGVYIGFIGRNNPIGGTNGGDGNVIAFNGGDGITVEQGSGNRILGNAIFANTGLGIDLDTDGVLNNDVGDSDSGANNRQNYPVLLGAEPAGGNTAILGSLTSASNTTYRLEFFGNGTADPSGFGEGETYLGFINVTTDASGNASFSFSAPGNGSGSFISATATDPTGNTSEFARSRAIVAPSVAIAPVTLSQNEGNSGTTAYSYTVTLSQPSSQPVTVNYRTNDGTATVADGDYGDNDGSLTFAPGVTSQTITVLVNGDTQFEADQSFTVSLSDPNNATLGTSTATGIIVNDDTRPTLAIAFANISQPEGNSGTTPYTYTVSLSNASDETITVNYNTNDGTATVADGDYGDNDGTLTFAPGVTSQSITVLVNGDTTYETTETFQVTLSTPVNASILAGSASGTITNDDVFPTLTVNNVSQPEGNSGVTAFTFTATLSQASGVAASVNYITVDGTATTANNDYVAQSGTLTFAPGETSKTITVTVNGDARFELDETLAIAVSNPTQLTIGTPTATGTIRNDEPPPSLSMTNVSENEGNAGQRTYVFTVSLSSAVENLVTVNYATADGTATVADNDYVATSGTLTFNPGETNKTITVRVNGDTTLEATETFAVNLTNPTGGAVLPSGAGIGTIGNDDGGAPDFNGDGNVDLIWRNSTSGINTLWRMDNANYSTYYFLPTVPGPDWQIVGNGDFDRDGDPDILWRNGRTGETTIWIIQNYTYSTFIALPTVEPNWTLAGVADFNADGNLDIVWRRADGLTTIWQMNRFSYSTFHVLGNVGSEWRLEQVADFNQDGRPEILWRNRVSGQVTLWQLNGFAYSTFTSLGVIQTDWTMAGVGDGNNDGSLDIIWRNQSTGQNRIWQMNGLAYSTVHSLPMVDADWQLESVADFSGDGTADILWFNRKTGKVTTWQLSTFAYNTFSFLPQQLPTWGIFIDNGDGKR